MNTTVMSPAQRLVELFAYHSSMMGTPPEKPLKLGEWLWASNGYVLVALADDGTTPSEPTPETRQKAGRYLDETPTELIAVTFHSLRMFAGDVDVIPPDLPCDACEGTGYNEFGDRVMCEHCGAVTRTECTGCGGDKLAAKPALSERPARVAGVLINRALLAYGLSLVPESETAHVGALSVSGGQALMVIGPDWRVAVMNMQFFNAEKGKHVPSFEPPPTIDAVDPQVADPGTPSTRD